MNKHPSTICEAYERDARMFVWLLCVFHENEEMETDAASKGS